MVYDLPPDNAFLTDAHNRRQNDAITALDAQISRTQARLNSEMRRIRGSLEQRLDRLSTSFDAFVELSDVRALLAAFPGPAAVRYRAHRLLEGAAGGDAATVQRAAGYWLCPASRGLAAAVRGDTGEARSLVAEAAGADALRAGTFALLGTAAAAPDQAPLMADWILPKVLQELPERVCRYERALWVAAADGLLGADARALVAGLAQEAARRAERGQDPAAGPEFWTSAVSAPRPPAPTKALEGRPGREQLEAAGRLSALRTWLEEVLERPGGGAGEQPDRPRLDDEAAETLRMLVGEGTSEEAPHLARANQLRAVIESSGTASPDEPAPAWTDPAGHTLELLRADATSMLAPRARRALAVGVYGTVVASAAEDLASAAAEPLPEGAEVAYHGQRMRITPQGADDASLREAEAALEASYAPERRPYVYAGIAAGAAVVLAVLVAVSGAAPWLWVAPAAALGAAGLFVYRGRSGAADAATAVASARRRLRDKVQEGAAEYRGLRSEAASAAERAREDLQAVRRLLAEA
ncbi:ATP-binding protein [Streptomonospora wellingtoniae]|uniref:Uncharacterized protein n=1 Tax=Streptomonospora wellingtoniae TaxID=3075544 RepID=A0ABU2KR76_9ACTN|nr:hypothetical protein [Streptomonospora sp. DSM 45055]MDT0301628.1 hypothetical protein [Streptomonospora sp. DSM 45055]